MKRHSMRILRMKIAAILRRVLSGEPAFFAVCCCYDREGYIGRERPEERPLDVLPCRCCHKYSRGCWGPKVEVR